MSSRTSKAYSELPIGCFERLRKLLAPQERGVSKDREIWTWRIIGGRRKPWRVRSLDGLDDGIIADTCIWIEYFRGKGPESEAFLVMENNCSLFTSDFHFNHIPKVRRSSLTGK
jgi:hypothetical protein